jgi:hypothetical protein
MLCILATWRMIDLQLGGIGSLQPVHLSGSNANSIPQA